MRTKKRGQKMNPLIASSVMLSILILAFSHTYLLFLYGKQPKHISERVKEGAPYIFELDEDYFGEINKIRVTNDYVYIMYGGESIVKVYQHDGTYVCTIAIYAKRGSGGTMMYTDDSKMYLQHANSFYEFMGIEFIKHTYVYQNNEVKDIKRHLKTTSSSGDYCIYYGNLFRQPVGSARKLFIERDYLHRLLQPRILLPMEMILVLIWIIAFRFIYK